MITYREVVMKKLLLFVFLLLLSVSCAYHGHMMPWGPMHYGPGGIVLWLVVAAIVVVIIVAIVGGSKTSTEGKETPLEILKKRYAKGEISKQEFDKIKKDIT